MPILDKSLKHSLSFRPFRNYLSFCSFRVHVVVKLLENDIIRVRQKSISMECKPYWVGLNPILNISRALFSLNIIFEFIVCYNVPVIGFCIFNAVRVIVVWGRSFNYQALIFFTQNRFLPFYSAVSTSLDYLAICSSWNFGS